MKLNQIVSLETKKKPEVYKEISDLDKVIQKPALFSGFSKTYAKINEDGENFSPEFQKVQFSVPDILKTVHEKLQTIFDITATKDFGNMKAAAAIVVDGKTLLKDVPVPYLLYLEKQLKDLETFISRLPVLDEQETWTLDKNNGVYLSDETQTHRTKKVQKPIVLYPATQEHPAQTQLISEDILVGYWNMTKRSGAISLTDRNALLAKVRAVSEAVIAAREAANTVDVDNVSTKELLDYIFG